MVASEAGLPAGVNAFLDDYNFPPLDGKWQMDRLVTPWARSWTALRLRRPGEALTLVLRNGSPDIGLIPLRHEGVIVPNLEQDPHNIAIFNSLAATVTPSQWAQSDWDDWTRCYFALTGNDPNQNALMPWRLEFSTAGEILRIRGADRGTKKPVGLWLTLSPIPRMSMWGRAEASEMSALNAKALELNLLMDHYDYGFHHWLVHTLRTPLLRRHEAFELLWTDPNRAESELVAIVPADNSTALALIPLAYNFESIEGQPLDLHNIAIFNRTMRGESGPPPADANAWLNWAQLYLQLCGEQPRVITESKHSIAPKSSLPSVVAGTNTVSVEFDDFEGDGKFEHWQFEFAPSGHLQSVHATLRPCSGNCH
ncbi:MAG TPA: hypothetical protein VN709_01025 [Terriglobales bacterium]|nr:hypothetical protein [Terriglobales bacterium]